SFAFSSSFAPFGGASIALQGASDSLAEMSREQRGVGSLLVNHQVLPRQLWPSLLNDPIPAVGALVGISGLPGLDHVVVGRLGMVRRAKDGVVPRQRNIGRVV